MSRFRRRILAALALSGLAVPGAAWAWKSSGMIEVNVHDHRFDRVAVEGQECKVKVRIQFNAPRKAYKSRVKQRNQYLFKARISFKDGKQLITPVFRSSSPARRSYRHTFDTSNDGCWSKEKAQVVDLDVVGCRGRRCEVPDFT